MVLTDIIGLHLQDEALQASVTREASA